MPRSAADWFEALATGRLNPFGSSTVGAVQYSIHEEMFRHARGRGETDLRTWSRNVFRNLGMNVDNEGARFSGRFIPHRRPGATVAPTPAPTPAVRTPQRPQPHDLPRRDDPSRGDLMSGRPGPRGPHDTVAGGGANDRLAGDAGIDRLAGGASGDRAGILPNPAARKDDDGRPRPPLLKGGKMPVIKRDLPPSAVDEASERARQQNEDLDEIEGSLRQLAKDWRDGPNRNAGNMLDHYLNGTGKPLHISRKEAREWGSVSDAEIENREKIEMRVWRDPKIRAAIDSLSDAPDGTSVRILAFDETSTWDKRVQGLVKGRLDEALAAGNSNLKSTSHLTATVRGDDIVIEGPVFHDWSDIYDFDGQAEGGEGAVKLEEAGKAKRYEFGARWVQEVVIVIPKGGELAKDPRVERPRPTQGKWTDFDLGEQS